MQLYSEASNDFPSRSTPCRCILRYMRSDQTVKRTNLSFRKVRKGRGAPGFPNTNKTDHFLAGNIAWKKAGEKLVSRCHSCLSRRFPFARARIFHQRELIWIKCLTAFQTPGDLNNFWLDLQTKQTIMMQACVKMYTAVKQQTPALDAFINVFSSFHQVLCFFLCFGSKLRGSCVLLLQRCGEKIGHKFMHNNTERKRVSRCFSPALAN